LPSCTNDPPENDTSFAVTDQPTKPQGSEVISEAELPEKLRTLWNKGLAALDVNNFDYTISLLQAVLKEEPRFLDGRKRLREAEVRKKEGESKRFGISKTGGISAMKLQPMVKSNPQAAIVQLEKEVLASEPHNPQGNQLLFEAAMRAEMPMTAGFALETLVKGNPENLKYMHQLGDFYMEHGIFDQAAQVFGQILQRDPTDLNANQKEKNASARSSMAKQNYGGDDFRKNLRNADQAAKLEQENRSGMTADQLADRISFLQAKYAENQNDFATVKALASLYEESEDYDQALSFYAWAHQLSNNDSTLEKKILEVQELQRAQKLKEFEAWLAANEGHEDYEAVKADYIAFKRQRSETQIQEFADQVEKNPTDNAIRFKYGQALFEADMLKEAIPQLQRAQQSPNLRIKAMLMLGKCYDGRGMYDLAVDQLQRAAGELQVMDETKKELLYNLGLVQMKMGNKQAAMDSMKQIYAVDYGYKDVAALVESSYA
jgi:tetratricopeptide (TPR) repeat protein